MPRFYRTFAACLALLGASPIIVHADPPQTSPPKEAPRVELKRPAPTVAQVQEALNAALNAETSIVKDADLAYNRGAEYYNAGQYDRAIVWFTRALALRPAFPQAHYASGLSHEALKEYIHAIADFTAEIDANPHDFYAFAERGQCYLALHDYNRAGDDWETGAKEQQKATPKPQKKQPPVAHFQYIDSADI